MATITGSASVTARNRLKRLEEKWKREQETDVPIPPVETLEDYNKLIVAVEEAVARNENMAALKTRVKALGGGVMSLAKTLKIF